MTEFSNWDLLLQSKYRSRNLYLLVHTLFGLPLCLCLDELESVLFMKTSLVDWLTLALKISNSNEVWLELVGRFLGSIEINQTHTIKTSSKNQ